MANTDFVGINHDIRNVNGCSIQMPPWFSGEPGWGNLALPNVYTLDTVQEYPHGTAFREGERTWFYTKYIGSVNTAQMTTITLEGCDTHMFGKGLANYGFQQHYGTSNIYGVAGEPTVYIITASASDVTERANDFYAGGTWSAYDTTHTYNIAMGGRIIKQVYSATTLTVDDYSITYPSILTLDQNLVANVTWGTAKGTAMPNKWKMAIQGQDSAVQRWMPILGASCVGHVSTYNVWLWLQTHGEIMSAHASSDLFGDEVDMVAAYWMSNGSLDPATFGTAYKQQLAGYIINNYRSESGSSPTELYPILYLTMIK